MCWRVNERYRLVFNSNDQVNYIDVTIATTTTTTTTTTITTTIFAVQLLDQGSYICRFALCNIYMMTSRETVNVCVRSC